MATLLSPGVYIEEVDASNIVPNISNNIAFFAGNFTRGPVEQPYVVTNKIELEQVFGYPTDANYNEWFQCYKFFDYANQLIISRAYESADLTTTPTINDSKQKIFKLYDDVLPTDMPSNNTVNILTSSVYDFSYSVGDWITLGNSTMIYTITAFESIEEEDGRATNPTKAPQLLQVTLHSPLGKSAIEASIATVGAGSDVFINSIRHLNGGTQAFTRGAVDVDGKPINAYAVSSQNIDYIDSALGFTPDAADNRFNYSYVIIKNKDEWDFNSAKVTNPYATFLSGDIAPAKLKFYNKTASQDVVQIAIANPEDFAYNDGKNYAIAFQTPNGSNIEYIYLTSLFQYYPQDDQIAIMFKMGDVIESYVVSFDELSVDGNNKSNYIQNVINEQSALIYVIENKEVQDSPATYLVCDKYGWETDSTGKINVGTSAENGVATTNLFSKGGRNPLVSIGALTDAYFTVEDKERFEIDVVIGNEYISGTYDNQNVAIDLATARKDCVAFIGARYVDTVEKKSGVATQNVINYILETNNNLRGNSIKLTRSMFGAFFANYFKIYDKYNKKSRYINCAGDVAGIRCQTSAAQDAWWVSAGVRRGILKNIDRLAFTPSQSQRDNLYKNGINPIVSFPGSGNLVWGNKTLHPLASSFDRINVRTLFNTLERSATKAARSQVFEFNDAYTRNAILSMFNPYLATVKAGRGIVDYLVICDDSNNTPDVISRNELRVDIYIKPNYAAEFILLTFTNVGTRSFASVIGA